MSVVPIVIEPNTVLHKVCEPITAFDDKTKKLVQNLSDTLKNAKNPPGAGLSAPQVGVLERVCIVYKFGEHTGPDSDSILGEYVLINPEIKKYSREKETNWEGCLSIPNTLGKVERSKKIRVEAYNEFGEKRIINASGFFARVIQHEIDHLDGILFTDKNRLKGDTISEQEFDKMVEEAHKKI